MSTFLPDLYDELSPLGNGLIILTTATHGFQGDFGFHALSNQWPLGVDDDHGWMWASDYSWGWAPFHYGRWFYDDYYGWWLPGYEWSPAYLGMLARWR